MNKSQAALTIGKLFGTAIALTIVLVGTVAIEGLQAVVKFGTWAVNELNKPQPIVTILPPETVTCELRTAEPESLSIQTIAIASPAVPIMIESSKIPMPRAFAKLKLSSVIEPFRLPINPYRVIINQLPRDVLSLKHLKSWAKSRNIKGYSKMSKAKLVAALSPA